MKLTLTKVNQIRNLLDKGWNSRKIALKYRVHHSTIEDIKNGLTWNPKRLELSRVSKIQKMQGENAPGAKLTEKNVKKIKKLLMQGTYSQNTIAQDFGVTSQLISLINTKRIWKHLW